MRRRTNKFDTGVYASLRECSVFRQEPVAGMDGVSLAALCRVNDAADIQIRLGGRGGTDAVGLISFEDMQRSTVGVRKNDRGDAKLVAGTNEPHRNLAAVSD